MTRCAPGFCAASHNAPAKGSSMIGVGKKLALGAGLAGLFTVYAMAQTELATGPFTTAQLEEGRKVYMARCAACHLSTLAGQGDALPLAGNQFMAGWSNRTTQDL